MTSYEQQAIAAATIAVQRGHADPSNLRELLVWTTSKPTAPLIEKYFSSHLRDKELLRQLVTIALEGEDAGDAPWAAANVIAQFPPDLLANHRAALEELAAHPWSYLQVPAKAALAKLAGRAT
jgi:hypothetical protein